MTNWKDIHPDFTPELQKEWEEKEFNYEQTKIWIVSGLKPQEVELAYLLLEEGYGRNKVVGDINIEEARRNFEINYLEWKDIHPNFDLWKIKKWQNLGFTYEQTKEWIDIGLNPTDADYACWIKDIKYKNSPSSLSFLLLSELELYKGLLLKKNNDQELRVEYQEYQEWVDIHKDFSDRKGYENVKEWKERSFDHQQVKEWIKAGLKPTNYLEAKYWKDYGFTAEQLQKWINTGFQLSDHNYAQKWRNHNFTDQQVQEWVKIGFKPKDTDYVKQWREKGFSTEQVEEWTKLGFSFYNGLDELQKWEDGGFNYEEIKLWSRLGFKPHSSNYAFVWKKEFGFQETKELIGVGFKIDEASLAKSWKERSFNIQQIVSWISVTGAKADDYEFVTWLRDTKKLSYEWVLNNEEKFKKMRETYCKHGSWTSDNQEIDEFIREFQFKATKPEEILEWIPYEKFSDIEPIAKGGFGRVYKAKWTDGYISKWNTENNQWERKKTESNGMVALKILNNSQNTTSFLQEITYHKLIEKGSFIVQCYGISQDPETKDYIMVMEYIPGGNLRRYLDDNYGNLIFEDKLKKISHIALGLSSIHGKNLVHHDFHSGNILNWGISSYVTDLGLSRPVNEEDKGKVFGVLPYIAPEVLNKQPYTPASDIYSFGIVVYEIFTGLPPYHDIAHEQFLALKICQGLRPKFPNKIPQLLKNLINQCWDAEPEKRPKTDELKKILSEWQDEVRNERDTEFYRQYKEVERLNINFNNSSLSYQLHSSAIYTSRLLNFKNLPKSQNSKEINEEFYNLKDNLQNLQTKTLEFNEYLIKSKESAEELKETNGNEEKQKYSDLKKVSKILLEKSRELSKELEKIIATNKFTISEEIILRGIKELRDKNNKLQGELEMLKNSSLYQDRLEKKKNEMEEGLKELKKQFKNKELTSEEFEIICQKQDEITKIEIELKETIKQGKEQLTQIIINQGIYTTTGNVTVEGSFTIENSTINQSVSLEENSKVKNSGLTKEIENLSVRTKRQLSITSQTEPLPQSKSPRVGGDQIEIDHHIETPPK